MTIKIKPILDRIVVKREEVEEKSIGGIILPESSKEKPSKGEVLAVGNGGRDEKGSLIPMSVKVGDKVLFSKWGGTEFKIDNQDLLILKESDIFGILE